MAFQPSWPTNAPGQNLEHMMAPPWQGAGYGPPGAPAQTGYTYCATSCAPPAPQQWQGRGPAPGPESSPPSNWAPPASNSLSNGASASGCSYTTTPRGPPQMMSTNGDPAGWNPPGWSPPNGHMSGSTWSQGASSSTWSASTPMPQNAAVSIEVHAPPGQPSACPQIHINVSGYGAQMGSAAPGQPFGLGAAPLGFGGSSVPVEGRTRTYSASGGAAWSQPEGRARTYSGSAFVQSPPVVVGQPPYPQPGLQRYTDAGMFVTEQEPDVYYRKETFNPGRGDQYTTFAVPKKVTK